MKISKYTYVFSFLSSFLLLSPFFFFLIEQGLTTVAQAGLILVISECWEHRHGPPHPAKYFTFMTSRHRFTSDLAIPLLHINPKELKTDVQAKIYQEPFLTALFLCSTGD